MGVTGQEEQVWIYGSTRLEEQVKMNRCGYRTRRSGVDIREYQVRRKGVDIREYQVRRTGVDIWE